MGEGIEGIGEMVTGGMAARAVEPRAGENDGHSHESACLNCGTPLAGEFCHACGQKAHVHRTLGAFWHDLLHGVLHFEGKIWRTLPLLAWRPGELTRRYVEGERARFVSPLALFLFSVFLMFAVLSIIGGPTIGGDPAAIQQELTQELEESRERVATIERERAAAETAGQPTEAIDRRLASAREEVALLGEMRERGLTRAATVQVSPETPGWIRKALEKAAQNPGLLFYKIQANAYKFSWMLIPLSVPFLWLMFLHRRRYRQYHAYDHVVFVTYSIAFMSLLLIVFMLLQSIGLMPGLLAAAFLLVPPVHMFRQLRGAYALSVWSALWRTVLLVNFAFMAAGFFFTILLALGVLG